MKHDLIDRYIYDVTRRLPEKERDEVRRELEANIADMLPDDPGEQAVIGVLNGLGAPAKMAEQYQQKPRYLISPALYDMYISVLKTVVPVVAIALACVGVFLAIPELTGGGLAQAIGNIFGMAIEGALQAAFWVTLGFAIAERTGKYKTKEWTVEQLPKMDLPKTPDQKGARISRSEPIVGMALTVFFTGLYILIARTGEPVLLFVRNNESVNAFSVEALSRAIPYAILLGCLGLAICGLKLYWGRWNVPLCVANAVHNVVWVSVMIYIFHWPDLFHQEFIAFAERTFTGEFDLLSYVGSGGAATLLSAAMIVIAAIDTGVSAWKTWKGTPKQKSENFA